MSAWSTSVKDGRGSIRSCPCELVIMICHAKYETIEGTPSAVGREKPLRAGAGFAEQKTGKRQGIGWAADAEGEDNGRRLQPGWRVKRQ